VITASPQGGCVFDTLLTVEQGPKESKAGSYFLI